MHQHSHSQRTRLTTQQIRRTSKTKPKHRHPIRPNNTTNNPTKTNNQHTNRRNKHLLRDDNMLVQISDKEQTRIKPAEKYFTELGCETEITNLQYGDYVFDNKVAFEYKTIQDFIASIQDNRVFNEAINQAENFDWHYVIIQGTEAERAKGLAMTKHYRPVTIFQYHGSIASINRYSTVIECYTPWLNESFYKMYIQAKKVLQDKPIVKRFGKKDKNPVFNFLCHDVYGINKHKAKIIVDELELNTLTDLLQLTTENLTTIDGIGESTANRIIQAIK